MLRYLHPTAAGKCAGDEEDQMIELKMSQCVRPESVRLITGKSNSCTKYPMGEHTHIDTLHRFIEEERINMRRLRKGVRVFYSLYPDPRLNYNYVDFCAVLDLDVMLSCAEWAFTPYSFDDFTTTYDEMEKRVAMRPFLVRLCGLIEGSLEAKIRFLYSLYDHDEEGFLPRKLVVEMLMASNFADEDYEVTMAANTIMDHARQAPLRGISAFEMYEATSQYPDLLWPYQPANQPLLEPRKDSGEV